jgi:transposase-like protein
MTQDADPFKGGSPIEMDETYVGARNKRYAKRGRSAEGSAKQPVFGMVQRGGRVAAMTVDNVKRATVFPIVQERILPRATVYTDYYSVYNNLERAGYRHGRINHSERVYVSGDVHTNTIEGFWSLVKRGLDGVFHGVSKKHLQGYLNEYAWRYNQRHDGEGRFRALLLRSTAL